MKNESAFPEVQFFDEKPIASNGGLTKLEWFAGMAMKNHPMNYHDHGTIAEYCFDLAEAMLKESERRRN